MSARQAVIVTKYRPPGRDYGYTNARLRGMRSRLLTHAFFEELMASKDIGVVIQKILQTGYGPDLENRILHGRTATQVDEALRDNMTRTFRTVLEFTNAEAHALITALLGRWDLFNVKTVIRAKHMAISEEEIANSLMAVGQLTQVDAEELARQADVKAVVDTLSTWGLPYAVPLRNVLPEYLQTQNLSLLELALDRYYYEWAAKRLSGRGPNMRLAREFLAVQVDTMNLLTCIRLLNSDLSDTDASRFFVPGGTVVHFDLFMDLASTSDVDELFNRIKRTPFGRQVEQVAYLYIEKGSVSVFERALENYLFRKAFVSGKGDPLGIGLAIGYLWTKANEVTNLRIVVKGVSVGMPVERMREELIVV
ncbi:MAG: V-type ATPase subunit [Coriobacteriia bacterium]